MKSKEEFEKIKKEVENCSYVHKNKPTEQEFKELCDGKVVEFKGKKYVRYDPDYPCVDDWIDIRED